MARLRYHFVDPVAGAAELLDAAYQNQRLGATWIIDTRMLSQIADGAEQMRLIERNLAGDLASRIIEKAILDRAVVAMAGMPHTEYRAEFVVLTGDDFERLRSAVAQIAVDETRKRSPWQEFNERRNTP